VKSKCSNILCFNENLCMKSKCVFDDCKAPVAVIIGDCKYCTGKFCLKHRLPETHACTAMQTCRDEHLKRLTDRLTQEATRATKL
jgi:predicted nucleic acid binding AN1-type Zn finger protein